MEDLEIELLFEIQVPPSDSIRKVMSPPFGGAPALRADVMSAMATTPAAPNANVVTNRRRRDSESKEKRSVTNSSCRFWTCQSSSVERIWEDPEEKGNGAALPFQIL